jgi:hypothetical protein
MDVLPLAPEPRKAKEEKPSAGLIDSDDSRQQND